jgi:methylglutaconyl-CoA hydratase
VIRAIGLRQTQRYFLTAESFDAETALSLGLIHSCVDDEAALNIQAETVIKQLLKNGPKALANTKRLLQHNMPLSTELVNYTIRDIAQLRISAEGQEGIKAFLEQTPPSWLES